MAAGINNNEYKEENDGSSIIRKDNTDFIVTPPPIGDAGQLLEVKFVDYEKANV